MKLAYVWLLLSYATSCLGVKLLEANPDVKRLYDDFLINHNRLRRPVTNVGDKPTVELILKLSKEMEVNFKNQVMTTNFWVEQKWFDYKLQWNPEDYGGVEMLYVPSEHIWLPDIVLYNNSDGNYEVISKTKATIKFTGEVNWKSPSIYKSSCGINVAYLPFYEQTRFKKFESSSYNGVQVNLKYTDQLPESSLVHFDIDLSEFHLSVKYDILEVPATRNEEFYPCCVAVEPFSDITFKLTTRRNMFFDTFNLIIDCMGCIAFSVLVYYFPSDSGEKRTGQVNIFKKM